jgi:hypothetical protein
MSDVLRDALRTVLNPKSIAVIGASENENKIGGTRGHVSAAGARLRAAGRSSTGSLPPLSAPTRTMK